MFIRSQRTDRHWLTLAAFGLAFAPGLRAVAATPQVAMALEHTVLLKADGTVWHWGVVDYKAAKVGHPYCDPTHVSVTTPVQVTGLSGVVSVAANGDDSFAVKSDGTVWQWGGYEPDGVSQCPTGSIASPPKQVMDSAGPLRDVKAIWARADAFFVFKTDGTLWAWGRDPLDRLGVTLSGQPNSKDAPTTAPVVTSAIRVNYATNANPPVKMAVGSTQSLALLVDGKISAWGGAQYGERGADTNGTYPRWTGDHWYDEATTAAVDNIVGIAAGQYKSLAVKSDGTLWVWGCNQYGELGDQIQKGTGANVPCKRLPVMVTNFGDAAVVATGTAHTTILKSDGTVWAMGHNRNYALGAPVAIAETMVPISVAGLAGVTAIDAIGECSSAITNDGKIWQWGMCNKSQQFARPTQIAISNVALVPQCGIANGNSFAAAPKANLCLIGSASPVTGNGPWSWTCKGSGTQTTSCSAGNGPIFTLQPTGASVSVLNRVVLKAHAVGKGAVAYQWYKVNASGQDVKLADHQSTKGAQIVLGPSVSGATTEQLTLVVALTDSGSYYVQAQDGANGGVTRSQTASVSVKSLASKNDKLLP